MRKDRRYGRTGALIDVMDALPHELQRARSHDVSLALPFYREIRENPQFQKKDAGVTVDIRVGEAKPTLLNISKAAPPRMCNYFSFAATKCASIGREFMESTANPMKTMPRVSFSFAKPCWNWRAD